eukprot:6758912-Pyramimonas_sp.AAC.1
MEEEEGEEGGIVVVAVPPKTMWFFTPRSNCDATILRHRRVALKVHAPRRCRSRARIIHLPLHTLSRNP